MTVINNDHSKLWAKRKSAPVREPKGQPCTNPASTDRLSVGLLEGTGNTGAARVPLARWPVQAHHGGPPLPCEPKDIDDLDTLELTRPLTTHRVNPASHSMGLSRVAGRGVLALDRLSRGGTTISMGSIPIC